jgi:hypothetical protein
MRDTPAQPLSPRTCAADYATLRVGSRGPYGGAFISAVVTGARARARASVTPCVPPPSPRAHHPVGTRVFIYRALSLPPARRIAMHRLRSARVKRAPPPFSLGERAIPFSAYRRLARAIIRDDNFIARRVNSCAHAQSYFWPA